MTVACRQPGHRRAFTLIEMLVVLAITIILFGLLFGPLNEAFQLTRQGQAMVGAQTETRTAVARVQRDIADAIQVFESTQRPLTIWTYSGWQNRQPAPDATPMPIQMYDLMLDLQLPEQEYYIPALGKRVPRSRIPGWVVDTLPDPDNPTGPRYPVILRPVVPTRPDRFRVRYFIGLRDNLRADGSGNHYYTNRFLWPTYTPQGLPVGAGDANTYTLYRVSFDPAAPQFANWREPNFFYNTQPRSELGNRSYADFWREAARPVMSGYQTDVIRWVAQGQNLVPQPLVTFTASPVIDESLDPNYANFSFSPFGGEDPGSLPPTLYQSDLAHWTFQASLTDPTGANAVYYYPDTDSLEFHTRPGTLWGLFPTGTIISPRITILDRTGGGLTPVFDSNQPNSALARKRMMLLDMRRGLIQFAIPRFDSTYANESDPAQRQRAIYFQVTPQASPSGDAYVVDLKQDNATLVIPGQNAIPTGFGAVRANADLGPTARVTAFSEGVVATSGGEYISLQRAGWTGLEPERLNRLVLASDLGANQYTIDYATGEILLSPEFPSSATVLVRYSWQNNERDDIVRASYGTRDIINAGIGITQYEPSTGQGQTVQLVTRADVRNQGR
jgi:prepilin-type N-terminal cleavage/methylation domain-containing protein